MFELRIAGLFFYLNRRNQMTKTKFENDIEQVHSKDYKRTESLIETLY